jgi:hypothetical protein
MDEYTNAQNTGPDMDLMIDDLSYEDAAAYVKSFLTSYKKTQAALEEKTQELNTWNERLTLAERNGRTDLQEEAKHRLHLLIEEKTRLADETQALHRKIVVLKEKLEFKAKNAGIPSGARAEQLLSDLQQLADVDEYKLNEALKDQQAEEDLAQLKAKLGML